MSPIELSWTAKKETKSGKKVNMETKSGNPNVKLQRMEFVLKLHQLPGLKFQLLGGVRRERKEHPGKYQSFVCSKKFHFNIILVG